MAAYDGIFDGLGLRGWCDVGKEDAPMSHGAASGSKWW